MSMNRNVVLSVFLDMLAHICGICGARTDGAHNPFSGFG